ncbi:hypothetical protein ACCS54_27665 [Rhizobium johnstonii]|uniref:hypothetical protein n=1 Tax=Rhizobium TaxID=379 RepID=UPI00183CADAC|nr:MULTISPECIES: hypothetical protein [Rhizobium]MBB4509582.1 hypothetical protein [Rhizobium leguminosarum]UIK21348.1 hypothetical protein LZK79_30650 [Rhizobium leguminosarum]WSH11818.1 hypothetical protein U8P72_30290 [Rhizobium johnstonii]WSH47474.1 hypothetical protein U8P77_26700 [Rhizobium johnstonii]
MISNRVDLSFVIDNEAAALIFAQAELACKSWRSALNRVLAARRVWPKDPRGGWGSSTWVIPGKSEAATFAAESTV